MASPQDASSTTLKSDDLIDAVTNVGNSISRVGLAVVTVPTYLLPEKSRADVISATNNLFNTIGTIHLSVFKTVVSGIGTATSGLTKVVSETSAQLAPKK
ncbi:MAG: hypothetical protein WCF99_12975 [Chloroflexales bacterium]